MWSTKTVRQPQAGPGSHIGVSGAAMQAWTSFWILDPKTLYLYCTIIKRCSHRWQNGVLRKRDHVVGAWAEALVGDRGVCRVCGLLGGGLGRKQLGAGRGPAPTGPLLCTQAAAPCWRPVSALPPFLRAMWLLGDHLSSACHPLVAVVVWARA